MHESLFLKKKYNLHATPEVEKAAKRKQARTGEKVPQAPEARIQNYLDRFKEITGRKDPLERERGLDALKRLLYRTYVIKPQEIPESYFENQRRLARELGHGDIEITPEMRQQHAEILVTDQKTSLDTWIDYLASPGAPYPDWLKYYAIRSVLGMGEYDKEKQQFTKRSKGTVKPFPDLNREALAYVLDAIEKKTKGKDINLAQLEGEDKEEFTKLLQSENFAKLYAWAIEKVTPESVDKLQNTKGQWIKYNQGQDHMPLVESLQGHGTGWCTAGESTAKSQLQGGDFYVYYSFDQDGKPTIPRAAIRMQGNQIGEVRGIGPNQNLDPYIGEVVQKKMAEFPDGKLYEKKAEDMARLTQIDNKTKANQPLTKDDLIFLYEINAPIQGFGYQTDPRIKEIRDQRNPREDAPIVLDCAPNQIAWNKKEIDQNTKGYIGPLFPGIFQTLQHLEHIYTAFPEAPVKRINLEIGGQTKAELEAELKERKNKISNYAQKMMQNKDFIAQKNAEQIKLIRLKVKDLFSDNKNHTTDEVYAKAEELGLELCPPEVGPKLRLQYQDQPLYEYLYVGMKQIVADGDPRVFELGRYGGGLWLDGPWARPRREWGPEGVFVFCLRKLKT